MSALLGKVLETARKFLRSLSPSVTMDEDDKPSETFVLGKPGGAVLCDRTVYD